MGECICMWCYLNELWVALAWERWISSVFGAAVKEQCDKTSFYYAQMQGVSWTVCSSVHTGMQGAPWNERFLRINHLCISNKWIIELLNFVASPSQPALIEPSKINAVFHCSSFSGINYMVLHRKLLDLSLVEVLLPDVCLSLSLHALLNKRRAHRLPIFALNKVLCLTSFYSEH